MTLTVRIGILGAAPIAAVALIRPSRRLPDVEVVAVAARDPQRATAFAGRYGIPRVHHTYAALLADPAIDAVYIALPNSLHAHWTIRALQAGKHVLCEKPLAANAQEAEEMTRAAADTGCMLMEAMHYRYHPLAARLKVLIDSGEIGQVRHLAAEFSVPLLKPGSVQFRFDLGGGATMDVGCYAINLIRFLAGAEPQVVHARARLIRPQVDRAMTADLHFADGCTAQMRCALLSARFLRLGASVYGTDGELHVAWPFLPHLYHHIILRNEGGTRHERLEGLASYVYQLRAFVDATRRGVPALTQADDAIANMRIIDAIYVAAGLRPRGQSSSSRSWI